MIYDYSRNFVMFLKQYSTILKEWAPYFLHAVTV
jgi:hypothetical protein